ncbi:MAG: hypothetical protein PHR28_08150 [candidate division Zixibacteria bacterium]|nr:hypothetical protein [candidate division Zixibacteria bacterium]
MTTTSGPWSLAIMAVTSLPLLWLAETNCIGRGVTVTGWYRWNGR